MLTSLQQLKSRLFYVYPHILQKLVTALLADLSADLQCQVPCLPVPYLLQMVHETDTQDTTLVLPPGSGIDRMDPR